ncbi:MAG: hypothetical protein ACKOA9_04035 [Actinomycetota bacterium]
MTDVLDRTALGAPASPGPSAPSPATVPADPGPPAFTLGIAATGLLAALAAAAGGIHLAMVPSHMDSSTAEGIGFAVVGWVQIVTAVLLVTRPSRGLLRFTMLSTAAFLGVWAVSRTWGLPFGEHAGHPHAAAFVDLAAVTIEVTLLGLAGLCLARPGWSRGWSRRALLAWAVVPIAVVALGTAAIASPSARNHAHASHGVEGTAGTVAADGHVHAHGASTVAAVDDKGFSQLTNGHQHSTAPAVKLDAASQTALTQQLNQLSPLIARYPNIAAAEAAGYRRAGPFTPGLGTHYGTMGRAIPEDVVQGVDGPMTPMLVFDGTAPDAPLAGFMLLSFVGSAAAPPEGFVGPNDHWHFHTNTCVVFRNGVIEAPLGADGKATPEDCRAVGGSLIKVTTSMVHVWTVPGYESPNGIFTEVNPTITCPDGTYYTVKQKRAADFTTNRCRSAAA